MPIRAFPNPRHATPEGLVALGGDLHPESLLLAYRSGIFPWPMEGLPITWFCPPKRAILEFGELHVPKSLAKARKRSPLKFTVDQAFARVIHECALKPRPDQPGTWITPQMIEAYCALHQNGHAHSVEAWQGDLLAGGLYGVEVNGVFAGESMFHHVPNASKLVLLHLVELLQGRGATWMDIQVLTPHMEALGAREISRDDFLAKLTRTQALGLRLFP